MEVGVGDCLWSFEPALAICWAVGKGGEGRRGGSGGGKGEGEGERGKGRGGRGGGGGIDGAAFRSLLLQHRRKWTCFAVERRGGDGIA